MTEYKKTYGSDLDFETYDASFVTMNDAKKILNNKHATALDRVLLVRALAYIGLTTRDIVHMINKENKWHDYDKQITKMCVKTEYKAWAKWMDGHET